ncbi:helix-turn-helix domain-containing protein [Candidatus Woesearchaeota archaeon]|nr:helix-turn-helix domain-containing protein [Candidatus Woesearchaeota archaeon]
MRKKDTFLLLSLEDEKAKKLANVISSDVCRKLLDSLATKESTETDLAKELGIPISTIHYNLKQLLESGLVKCDEFHYSQKGKEVNHYSIANKYIIIAPKNTESISSKIKRLLPVFAAVSAAGLIIQLLTGSRVTETGTRDMMVKTLSESSDQAQQIITQPEPSLALWFILGALFALIVFLLYDVAKERFK